MSWRRQQQSCARGRQGTGLQPFGTWACRGCSMSASIRGAEPHLPSSLPDRRPGSAGCAGGVRVCKGESVHDAVCKPRHLPADGAFV